MKRARNSALILILIVSFAAGGCSEQYQSERHLYRATRLARNILINPDAIPPQEFQNAIEAYEKIYEKYPGSWAGGRAMIAIGSLYLAKEQYEKARDSFSKVLELYPDDQKLSIEARFAIAKSHEKEHRWDRALAEYNRLIEDYPDTGIGLSLPMYIASKESSYRSVIPHYEKLANEHPGTPLGFRAESFIVMCYLKEKDWYGAVSSLEKLIMDYPNAQNIGMSIRMIGDLSVKKLEMPGLAAGIFERFLKKYPDHALKEGLEKALEAISDVPSGQ